MFVSFDDGDRWQSLQLNLPTTPYRDIMFAGNDLVVGTFGRGIWVLDDYAVLRQMTNDVTREPVHLFTPPPAVRVRRNVGYNTPFPPEVPHALNPAEGVPIDYWLANKPTGEITLDVLDSAGASVRHLSSIPAPPVKEAAQPPHPNFWIAPPTHLPTDVGANRANWDLRYDPPPAFVHSFEINANPGLTPPSPVGARRTRARTRAKLTVDGRSYTTKVTVTNDPRSPATTAAVHAQVALQLATGGRCESRTTGTSGSSRARAGWTRSGDRFVAVDEHDHRPAGSPRQPAAPRPDDRFGSVGLRRVPTDFAGLHGRLEELFRPRKMVISRQPKPCALRLRRAVATSATRWRDGGS